MTITTGSSGIGQPHTLAPKPNRGDGVWIDLMWSELARVLRHPAFVSATALVVVPWLLQAITRSAELHFTVLHVASRDMQIPLLLPAAGAFLAGTSISVREHRFNTSQVSGTMSMPQWQRRAAQLCAMLGPLLVVAIIAGARMYLLASSYGAAGRVQIWEVIAAPLNVLLAGILGVLLGQLFRSLMISTLALATIGVLLVVSLTFMSSPLRWLTPVATEDPFNYVIPPADLVARPAFWHAIWLLTLALLAAALSLAVAGLRSSTLLMVSVALVLFAAVSAVAQTRPVSEADRTRLDEALTQPSKLQECQERGNVTYCVFPEFESWIDPWQTIVDNQLTLVPAEIADRRHRVRQRLGNTLTPDGFPQPLPWQSWAQDDAANGTPGAVSAPTRWATGGVGDFSEEEVVAFAVLFASSLVDVDLDVSSASGFREPVCGAPGVLVYWLAFAGNPEVRAALFTLNRHTSGAGLGVAVLQSQHGLFIGPRERLLGEDMLQVDQASMAEQVRDNWALLIDPSTTVDEAAVILGLEASQESFDGFLCS